VPTVEGLEVDRSDAQPPLGTRRAFILARSVSEEATHKRFLFLAYASGWDGGFFNRPSGELN